MGELRDKFLAELQGMQQSGGTSPHIDIKTAITGLEETALSMGVLRDMLSAELQDLQQSGAAAPHTKTETTTERQGVEQGVRGSEAPDTDTDPTLEPSAPGTYSHAGDAGFDGACCDCMRTARKLQHCGLQPYADVYTFVSCYAYACCDGLRTTARMNEPVTHVTLCVSPAFVGPICSPGLDVLDKDIPKDELRILQSAEIKSLEQGGTGADQGDTGPHTELPRKLKVRPEHQLLGMGGYVWLMLAMCPGVAQADHATRPVKWITKHALSYV